MLSLKRIPARTLFLLVLLVSLFFLAGCAQVNSPSPLNPASTNAAMIFNLAAIIFWIAVAVFVIVEGMLLYSVIRFSRERKEGEPAQIQGNIPLEIAWTAAPAIVLLIVFVISLRTLFPITAPPTSAPTAGNAVNAPSPQQANVLHVTVVGHQWWWEFDYPDLHIVTATELHVPVDTEVYLQVESVDVIHSFWVPQLGGKIDAIPGHTNFTWFDVTQPGTYHGQCAEFCGIEHADMRFDVVAESSEAFQTWMQQQQAAIPAMTGEAAKGEQIFLSGACVGCHTINGTKAQGTVGPNLTHFASRKVFAGAIMANTAQDVAKWLTNPQAVKPGALMPNLHLTQDQINALVAFLESLK